MIEITVPYIKSCFDKQVTSSKVRWCDLNDTLTKARAVTIEQLRKVGGEGGGQMINPSVEQQGQSRT